MNNSDRIIALDSLRKRPSEMSMRELMDVTEPSWMRPRQRIEWVLYASLASGVLGLASLIAIGLWNAVQTPALDDYTRQTVAECQAQGYVATVERSQSGAVLGVRCNAERDVRRP